MARAAQNQAKQNFNNSQDTFGQAKGDAAGFGGNASHIYGTLEPQLEAEAANPQGYGQVDLNAMNTAVGQSTGGATAGAKGEGYLDAARTGNRGGFQTALDESAREGMRTNANAALNIQGKNAELKEKQKQLALAGLGNLYGENSGNELKALGLENESIGAGNQSIGEENQAGQSGWFQNLIAGLKALNPGYSKSGGFSAGG